MLLCSCIPLHHINLKSGIVSTPVTVGAMTSLYVGGVQLLVGNDLAGDKVVLNPLVTSTPSDEKVIDPIEQEILDLCPACEVTQIIPPAPLKPIQAFEEPFSRVIVDCVGPFHWSFPLRNIKYKLF